MVDLHDAGVMTACEQLGLVLQAGNAVCELVVTELQHLEGDGAVMAAMNGAIDVTHTAGSEYLAHQVRPDDDACEEARRRDLVNTGKKNFEHRCETRHGAGCEWSGFDALDLRDQVGPAVAAPEKKPPVVRLPAGRRFR